MEVQGLTGEMRMRRVDILHDVGHSLVPSIDKGQIEGAFIQGMGWSTIEEVVYADNDHTWIRPRGALFTTGPGTYKIPAFNDVPEVFNVSLLDDVDNPFAVHSSKAIGEPPFFLGSAVCFILVAVRAAESLLICFSLSGLLRDQRRGNGGTGTDSGLENVGTNPGRCN